MIDLRRAVLASSVLSLVLPGKAVAGAQETASAVMRRPMGLTQPWRHDSVRGREPRTRWWAPAASALVPGAGQAVLGQDRFVAYLMLEGYGWLQYVANVREGRHQRRAYRALARDVARASFGDASLDGDFDYYERMQHYVESGVYDRSPGGDLQPETDAGTFNGEMWLLARQTYWDDPDVVPDATSLAYRNAVAFYERRAVRPEFRWSWRDAQLEQDVFRGTIRRSNDAYRRSVESLGLVIANHVLSTVDSYVTLRLRGGRGAERVIEARVPLPRWRAR